jgi:hypothetical protein
MEQGNNIECLKTFRLKIPLYNETSAGVPGQKYFFPDITVFKGKNIVGIDCNLQNNVSSIPPFPVTAFGDLDTNNEQNLGTLLSLEYARFVLCTIYDEDGIEKFYNVPVRSFFALPSNTPPSTKKQPRRVKPYCGKINPRKSYFMIPNGAIPFSQNRYVSLTFYYN